jgi:hypothetical protein
METTGHGLASVVHVAKSRYRLRGELQMMALLLQVGMAAVIAYTLGAVTPHFFNAVKRNPRGSPFHGGPGTGLLKLVHGAAAKARTHRKQVARWSSLDPDPSGSAGTHDPDPSGSAGTHDPDPSGSAGTHDPDPSGYAGTHVYNLQRQFQ